VITVCVLIFVINFSVASTMGVVGGCGHVLVGGHILVGVVLVKDDMTYV
jgi:hypothetical protein